MKKIIISLGSLLVFAPANGQIPNPLIFNFDSGNDTVYFDSSPGNVWQIGLPQKTFFSSAYTFPNAIVTDTINSYPVNNTSVFIVRTPTYMSNYGGVVMNFKHKFDTDTLADGGTIEVSLDSINWTGILSSPNLLFANGVYSNAVGFSGKSNGWQTVDCFWNYPPSQYLFIKFKFTSDNIQNNKEGWMIDTLRFEYNLGIGMNEMKDDFSFSVYPNPSTGMFSINASEKIERVEIYDLLGEKIYLTPSPSPKGEGSVVDLSNQPKGIYFVKVISEEGNYSVKKIIIE